MTKLARVRNWCFTDFELLDFSTIFDECSSRIRYICWGKETCPKTSKVHFQGWVQFEKQERMTSVKKLFKNKKIHLEPCLGTEAQNEKYCQKENEYETRGEFKTFGQRTDLKEIAVKIQKGMTLYELAINHPDAYIRYGRRLKDYKQIIDKERLKEFRHVEVCLLWGETGLGKTRLAMEEAQYKIQGSQLKWWDGYDGEDIILIDEYNNDVSITEMLCILDGYQFRLPIKGSFTYAAWTKVYITTNLSIDELHPNAKPQHRRALFRRIDTIKEVT